MSGGGSVPQAPNLSANTSNANSTFNAASNDASQTYNTAQAYNANAQKALSGVTSAQTPMMNKVNQTASQNLSTYGSTFSPLQQQQAQEAKNWTSDSHIQALQGQAVGDQNAALQASLNNQREQLASEGVDPASVHGSALTHEAAVSGAAANANAANQAYLGAQQTGYGMVSAANQLGTQVGQMGTQGAAAGSDIGSTVVGENNQTNSSGVNNLTAANTFLNTGTNANMSGAQIQNMQFNDALQQEQAAAANGPMGQIGTLAGAAMKAYSGGLAGGGVVPAHTGALPTPADYSRGGSVTHTGALPVSPIPGSTDTKPAFLTPGEFVMPHDVASWMGHEKLFSLMDKAREAMHARAGLPPPMNAALTARGH